MLSSQARLHANFTATYCPRPNGRHLSLQVQATGSTFGHSFRVTTFGESHGGAVGCVVDGVPPRLQITQVVNYIFPFNS